MSHEEFIQEIDFDNFSICFSHLEFLSAKKTKYSYENPIQINEQEKDGVRCNAPDVTWPMDKDYLEVLDKTDFDTLKKWPMEPIIIYAEQKGGNWRQYGWNLTQDMAEGSVCVDDNARAALVYLYDYLFEVSDSSLKSLTCARNIITWLGYMITQNGEMYNFSWLAPKYFKNHPNKNQHGRKHFMDREDYYAKKDDGTFLLVNGEKVEAKPYRWHQKYSIFMNDINRGEVPFIYDKPLYNNEEAIKMEKPTNHKIGVALSNTTSSKKLGLHYARTIWSFSVALQALDKADDKNHGDKTEREVFRKFVKYHLTKLLAFVIRNKLDILKIDSKFSSVLVVGLIEYFFHCKQMKDKCFQQKELESLMDDLLGIIKKEQIRDASNKHHGIFMYNHKDGQWASWGELQMYALARAYRYQKKFSKHVDESLLDYASFAADTFYGNIAYKYRCCSPCEWIDRITELDKFDEKSNECQQAYGQSPIILGLHELALAWQESGKKEIERNTRYHCYSIYMQRVSAWFLGLNSANQLIYNGKKGNHLYPFEGVGSSADGINGDKVNGNHGAESTIETLLALIFTKRAFQEENFPKVKFVINSSHKMKANENGIQILQNNPFPENPDNWGKLDNRVISKYAFCFFDTKTLKIASVASRNSYNAIKEIESERMKPNIQRNNLDTQNPDTITNEHPSADLEKLAAVWNR